MGSIKQENPLIPENSYTKQIKGKVKDIQFLQANSDEKDWLILKILLSLSTGFSKSFCPLS